MKTGILILLTSLVWNLQLSGQMIPENVTLKQLDGKEITFKEAVQQGPYRFGQPGVSLAKANWKH